MPTFDFLFAHLRKAVVAMEEDLSNYIDHYQNCLNTAWLKLTEYYSKTNETRLYRAAMALHPCLRYEYFEQHWKDNSATVDDVTKAKNAVKELYGDYVQRANECDPPPSLPPQIATEHEHAAHDSNDDLYGLFLRPQSAHLDQQHERRRK